MRQVPKWLAQAIVRVFMDNLVLTISDFGHILLDCAAFGGSLL